MRIPRATTPGSGPRESVLLESHSVGARWVLRSVMRWRNFIICLVLLGLLGWTAKLRRGRTGDQAVLPTMVKAYYEHPDGVEDALVADTSFEVPPGFYLTAPRMEIEVEVAGVWRHAEAVTLGGFSAIPATALKLQAGGKNRMAILLPSGSQSWRLLVSGESAGLRTRCNYAVGSWARDDSGTIRPVWRWLIKTLPNSPGPPLLLKSKVLPVKLEHRPTWRNNFVQAPPVFTRPPFPNQPPVPLTVFIQMVV
jgi:hypothetical protein